MTQLTVDSMTIACNVIFVTRSGDESVRIAEKGRNKMEINNFVKDIRYNDLSTAETNGSP